VSYRAPALHEDVAKRNPNEGVAEWKLSVRELDASGFFNPVLGCRLFADEIYAIINSLIC